MRPAAKNFLQQHDHERLLDELRDIMDEVNDRGVLDDAALSQRLAAWFGDHFRSHDVRLHCFLTQ